MKPALSFWDDSSSKSVKGSREREVQAASISRATGLHIFICDNSGKVVICSDALVTCDDTTAHKPDPEPALIGLGQLRGQEGSGSPEGVLTAEEALFVGDTRFDIDCAHNAGIPAALVAWSATMKKEDPVQTWPAEYYLESPEQLVEILRG